MKSFNVELDKFLVTIDNYITSDTDELNFYKECTLRGILLDIKNHIKLLKTVIQFESSRKESDLINNMFLLLSDAKSNKNLSINNYKYKFLSLVTEYIYYTKFNSKFQGDKPEEIPLVLDNLIAYTDELCRQSKERVLSNCLDEKEVREMQNRIDFLDDEDNLIDDRPV